MRRVIVLALLVGAALATGCAAEDKLARVQLDKLENRYNAMDKRVEALEKKVGSEKPPEPEKPGTGVEPVNK